MDGENTKVPLEAVEQQDGALPVPQQAPAKQPEASETKENGEEEKKLPKPGLKDLVRLFRYATPLDCLLMAIGTITGVLHGVSLPILMLLFGELINFYIYQEQTSSVANCLDISADSCNNVFFSNTSFILPCGINSTLFNGATLDLSVEAIFGRNAQCLTDRDFTNEVSIYCIYFVIVGIGVFFLAYIEISFFQMACERQVRKIRLFFYKSVLRQNIGWFDSNPSGELASRLNDDIEKIHDGIGDKAALFIQWTATFFGGFIIGFVRDWRLTLLLVAFTPFLVVCGAIFSVVITRFSSAEQKEYAGAGAVAEEVLSSIRTVVAFGGEYEEATRYDAKLKEAKLLGAKKGFSVGTALFLTFFVIFLVDSAAFWFGAYLISEELSIGGDVITVFFAVLIGAFALGQAMPNLENLTSAAGASIVIFQTIDRVPEIDSSSSEGETPATFDSTVQFNNVWFQYPSRPDVPVLQEFSLKVAAGQTVALVGASGCGKSTVMQLIQRFYDLPEDGGEVLISGKNVKDLNLQWLRSNLGVVSQEPVLFDTTIAGNIRYGRVDVSQHDIESASRKANAYDFISALPDGFNTLVGERGTQLSGGQKQRIAIARALIRDPKLLLLDEATSALDTESEKIVQEALDKARKGRTTIVIAHRLSTIKNADLIVAVDDGSVVEVGTHNQLMDNENLYYELVTAQSLGVDEAIVAGGVGRAISRRYRKRSESGASFHRKASVHRQQSEEGFQHQPSFKKQLTQKQLSKLQEEWDKDTPKVSILRVIKLNAREWWIILIGVIGAAVNGCIWPAFGFLFGEILEVFALPPDQILDEIHVWAGLFIVLGVVSGVGVFLKAACFAVSGENLTARLRSLSFRAMLRQEIGWHDDKKNSTGALTTRLANDASQVQGATGTRLGTLIETAFGLSFALLIALVYSWILTFVILAAVPILIISGLAEATILTGHTKKNKEAIESAGKIAVDSVDNIRTVASLGLESTFYSHYMGEIKRPYRRGIINSSVYGLTYAFSQATIYFMYAAIFRFGAYQVTRPNDDIAHESFEDIFRVFTALIFGAIAVGQAGAFAPNYTKARLSSNRIFQLLDRVPLIDGYSVDGETPDDTTGAVETENLQFRYPTRPDVFVLNGLKLSISPGKTLALVGPSGCGKSTIVSLLERFYDPSKGKMMLDGRDLRDLNIRWLRSQVGIVSQEPVLFDTSIAENIRYGANFREVSDEEVVEAAKAANIHNFVESLPEGYNANVGSKGAQLSGGQKQRIAIARALIRDPKLLLLDEATSALDTESEKIVQEALDKAREGRTSIVIAHRLSTIYNADHIAVINGGKVMEEGTHAKLLGNKGMYYRLNRFQMLGGGAADVGSPAHQSISHDPGQEPM